MVSSVLHSTTYVKNLCRDYGFHLCQEHFWWNPAKLPTPAEWVNVRRVRVKDAVNCIWWLSQSPWPKASNKRVLAPYSDSMKSLLKNGYKPKLYPQIGRTAALAPPYPGLRRRAGGPEAEIRLTWLASFFAYDRYLAILNEGTER